jgi:hypothetical protein
LTQGKSVIDNGWQGCHAGKEAKAGKPTNQCLRNLDTGQRQSRHDCVRGEDACNDAEVFLGTRRSTKEPATMAALVISTPSLLLVSMPLDPASELSFGATRQAEGHITGSPRH